MVKTFYPVRLMVLSQNRILWNYLVIIMENTEISSNSTKDGFSIAVLVFNLRGLCCFVRTSRKTALRW